MVQILCVPVCTGIRGTRLLSRTARRLAMNICVHSGTVENCNEDFMVSLNTFHRFARRLAVED